MDARSPAAAVPFEIIQMALSIPDVLPDWASPVLLNKFALLMNCLNEPCPVLFVLTMALKLKPKSIPEMLPEPITAFVTDWAVPETTAVKTYVVVLNVAPAEPLP